MARKPHVFGYEHEPATERPTGVGRSGFNHTTVASGWVVSQQSTFDEPSHVVRKEPARNASIWLIWVLALAVVAISAATTFVLVRS